MAAGLAFGIGTADAALVCTSGSVVGAGTCTATIVGSPSAGDQSLTIPQWQSNAAVGFAQTLTNVTYQFGATVVAVGSLTNNAGFTQNGISLTVSGQGTFAPGAGAPANFPTSTVTVTPFGSPPATLTAGQNVGFNINNIFVQNPGPITTLLASYTGAGTYQTTFTNQITGTSNGTNIAVSSSALSSPFVTVTYNFTTTAILPVTTTTVGSAPNPSVVGQSVAFTATVTGPGGPPTGTVTFNFGDGTTAPVTLVAGVATVNHSYAASGSFAVTAAYGGDANFGASTGSTTQNVGKASSTVALASSLNPSQVGQAVTFTATVSSSSGTPTGSVTFNDGATPLGSVSLAGGVAAFTTSSLMLGNHSITASYAGAANFNASTSAALMQVVNTPTDSLKLRAMQTLAAPVVAQASGQAISGAIDNAIAEGFSGGGALIMPSGNGARFNFAADLDANLASAPIHSTDPFSSVNGSFASSGSSLATQPSSYGGAPSRFDNGFAALAYAGPTKAPPLPRYMEQSDWLGWAEVRGAILDHWGAGTGAFGTVASAPVLYGNQVNLLAGLTRRLLPNFLVGVIGGYETFDYRSDALQGRLKGDGWTVGSYFGWKITQNIRFDAAVAYSGIGYDGTAGTASASFGGNRWLVTSGFAGTYQSWGLLIEPSARVYALWEHENAYTDSLGTSQAGREFSTGRASAGAKVSYPFAWTPTVALAPYVGLYGDYYFNTDNAGALAIAPAIPTAVVLDGWSARVVGGLTARFGNGAQIAVGTERSGIGANFGLWTYRARASVPFGAQ